MKIVMYLLIQNIKRYKSGIKDVYEIILEDKYKNKIQKT